MQYEELVPYRERLRTLLILYFFSDEYSSEAQPDFVRSFQSEMKIHKLDFLLRYPSYVCYELLRNYEEIGSPTKSEVKAIVRNIFGNNEPELRTEDMQRFFYGAYEELNDVIGFLKSVGLIDLRSKKNHILRDTRKTYFITRYGADKVENALQQVKAAQWYIDRCLLIKQYLGYMSGNVLRARQYDIDEYKDTPMREYIADIEEKVHQKYQTLFGETL
jgi:hypothetical protein